MKKILLFIILISTYSNAQLSIGTNSPSSGSQLEVSATDKGILIPRVSLSSLTDTSTINGTLEESLLLYNTTNNANIDPGYYYWKNDQWNKLIINSDIPEQVKSDWNASSGDAQILNKPADLSDFNNDLNFINGISTGDRGEIRLEGTLSDYTANLSSLNVLDTRSQVPGTDGSSSYMPKPNDSFFDKSVTPIFSYDWGESTWGSVLTVKGWSGNYAAWQIGGPATSSNSADDNLFYFRSGVGENWNPWRRIWNDGDFTQGDINNWNSALQSSDLNGYATESWVDNNYLPLTGGILDNGTNTKLTIQSTDNGESILNLVGDSQGTGKLYVGQSISYGGGIEYNGDGTPTSSGSGSDYITFFRREGGNDTWTARNRYNSDDWEFKGNISSNGIIYANGGNSNLWNQAEENVNADWNASSGDAQILNKPTNLSEFTNDLNLTDNNNYVDGVSFYGGDLNLSRSGLSDLNVDLDGRYYKYGEKGIPTPSENFLVTVDNVSSTALDWNALPDVGGFYNKMANSGSTNDTPKAYHYPFQLVYSNGNKTQFAFPYRTVDKFYMRSRYSDTWTDWVQFWDSNDFTQGDINNWNSALQASDLNGYATESWVNDKFIRSDQSDVFSGKLSVPDNKRNAGIYGNYNSFKIGHIWSMGTNYAIPADGSDFGNLYGIAYKHTNNSTSGNMAGGHQVVFTSAGTPGAAISLSSGRIWTKSDGNSSQWNQAEENVNADWSATSGDAEILNKPTTLSGYGITDAYTQTEVNNKLDGLNLQKVTENGASTNLNVNVKSLNFNSVSTTELITLNNFPILIKDGSNLGIGSNALRMNSGVNSSALGANALYKNSGAHSNGFGYNALSDNSGLYAIGMGNYALSDNTGNVVTGIGFRAFEKNEGSYSNAVGFYSGTNNTGTNSNGFGTFAISDNKGSGNNGFGNYALRYTTDSSQQLTAIGDGAAMGTSSNPISFVNSTAIGSNSDITASNQVTLGDIHTEQILTTGEYEGSGFKITGEDGTKILRSNGSYEANHLEIVGDGNLNISSQLVNFDYEVRATVIHTDNTNSTNTISIPNASTVANGTTITFRFWSNNKTINQSVFNTNGTWVSGALTSSAEYMKIISINDYWYVLKIE